MLMQFCSCHMFHIEVHLKDHIRPPSFLKCFNFKYQVNCFGNSKDFMHYDSISQLVFDFFRGSVCTNTVNMSPALNRKIGKFLTFFINTGHIQA